ncbi:MAG: hypothetical protein JXR70_02760 [Spirochaetales bacterium]|nr:hypothetical protein [Spirochaetales bacterium]
MNKHWFFLLVVVLNASFLMANIVVVGALTHEDKADPGDSYTGVITIQNPEKSDQEVKVYQSDYFFLSSGEVFYNDPATGERSNAGWIEFSPKRLVIPANELATVHYTVTVPKEKLIGTFWSMIMVEDIPEDSSESSQADPKEVALGIHQAFRYAVQMVTHVGQGGKKSIKFLQTNLVKEKDHVFLQLDVKNTGELWLRANLWVEVFDLKGKPIGKFDGGKLRIYPETSVRYRVDLTGLSLNTYRALVIIDAGNDTVFGANLNLEIK